MARYRIEMSQTVRDLVTHLPPQLKRRVKEAFRTIAGDPSQAKALKDELAGLRSYRIGRMRLILGFKAPLVEVIACGPRSDIYERAAAELSAASRKMGREKSHTTDNT